MRIILVRMFCSGILAMLKPLLAAAKKRKVEDGSTPAASGVKQEPGSSTSTHPAIAAANRAAAVPKPAPVIVKKEPGKAAVTDMSFFGAPAVSTSMKPKHKLPDIKKREPAVPTISTTNAAGSSSLLSATMSKLLKKADSPIPTSAPLSAGPLDIVLKQEVKLNKKGHTVKFKDSIPEGGALESIREFTQAPHEHYDAPWKVEDDVHGMSTHQLDMDEGKALRAAEGIEEVIDWYEPDGKFSSLRSHPD